MTLHIHTQGRLNNYTACSLYRIMVTASSVVGMMKMGNIMPRAELELTSLAFRASVLPLQFTPHRLLDVTTLPKPTCLCGALPQGSVQTTTLS